MKELNKRVVEESIKLRKWLWEESHTIIKISQEVLKTLQEGRKILLFGNGGSAADAQHIAAEMVGKFKCERNPFPAVALTTNTSILTSISNDYSFEEVFARQVTAVGESGDLCIGITTSGNSENVIRGILKAKELGMKTIALTGGDGGKIKEVADISLIVPSFDTARIQEVHITVGHIICEIVEENFK